MISVYAYIRFRLLNRWLQAVEKSERLLGAIWVVGFLGTFGKGELWRMLRGGLGKCFLVCHFVNSFFEYLVRKGHKRSESARISSIVEDIDA